MGLARAVAREQFFNALVTAVWSGIVFSVCECVFAGGRGCVRVGALSFFTRTADDAHPWRSHSSSTQHCNTVRGCKFRLAVFRRWKVFCFWSYFTVASPRPLMSHPPRTSASSPGLPCPPPPSSLT